MKIALATWVENNCNLIAIITPESFRVFLDDDTFLSQADMMLLAKLGSVDRKKLAINYFSAYFQLNPSLKLQSPLGHWLS